VAKKLGAEQIEIEGPEDGSRTRPDGKALHWKALRLKDDHGGLLPFFIEWSRRSLHPSADAPPGCSLMGFSAASNDPEGLRKAYAQMGLSVNVEQASKPGLRAQIKSAKGILDLSS
jgi:Glyoxalase-like domain